MIIFLHGPDDYRREQRKKEIIADFRKKRSALGLGYFDFSEKEGFPRFREFLKNQSIFEPTKLAVLENISDSATEASLKELAAGLKLAAKEKNANVLISEGKRPESPLDFLLRKSAGILLEKFDYFEGAEWRKFILNEAKKLGLSLSAEALGILMEIYQKNTWGLITELQKMSLWGKSLIGLKDLEKLELELAPDFWDLINGLAAYRLNDRLWALEKVFSVNEPAGKIFNIMAYQKKEKLPKMAAYDLAVKSGKMDYEEALLDLAIS